MIVRAPQLEVFERDASRRFEDDLLRQLTASEPALFSTAGDQSVRRFIRTGIEKARYYGFRSRSNIRFYLAVMTSLGWEFDRDPQYSWAVDTLADSTGFNEHEQAGRLYFHLMNYLDRVHGPAGENALAALRRTIAPESLAMISAAEGYQAFAAAWLQSLFPLKCGYMGPDALNALIQEAPAVAADYGLEGPDSLFVVLGLMFAFGGGAMKDPLYARVFSPSEDKPGLSSSERLTRLIDRSTAYIKMTIRVLEKA